MTDPKEASIPSAPPSYDITVDNKNPYNQPPQPYPAGYQQTGGYPPQGGAYPPQSQTAPYPQEGFQSSQFSPSGYAPVASSMYR